MQTTEVPRATSFRRRLADGLRRPGLVLSVLALLGLLGWGGYKAALYLRAWSHYRAAERALQQRDFAAARRGLAICLETWPNSPAVHLLAAQAARRAGDLDEAQGQVALAQRLADAAGDATVDTTLEWALLEAQRGNLTSDYEAYLLRRLHEGCPQLVLILEVLTRQYMRTQRLVEARQLLDQWLELEPDEAVALVRRGWVCEHMFDSSGALRDYTRALVLDPGRDSVRLHLATILVQKNAIVDAQEHLEQLRQRQPDNPAVLVELARCQRQQDQFEAARQLLDELLARHPDDAQGLSERGVLALEQGQLADAERLLRRAVERDPYDRRINYNLFQCLQRRGNKEEADRCAAKLRRIDDDLKRMGKIYEEVLKKPHDPALHYEGGVLFLRNGMTNDGLQWLGLAVQDDPGYQPAHRALVEYYEKIGDHDRAAQQRRFLQAPAAGGQR